MRIYRAFATVGGLTMLSRVMGFARDVMIAAVLGANPVAEAFFAAQRFPNLFRRLFGEGAFNAAFVPLFAKRLKGEGAGPARAFAEDAMAGLTAVLLLFSALAMIAMPWLTLVNAPGFHADSDKFELTVLLTRVTFPYLVCMSLVALLSGVLNSLNRFIVAALAPTLFNLTLIAALGIAWLVGAGASPLTGKLLAWGVCAAGFIQLALLWVAARRAGFGLGLRRPVLTPDMRQLIALGIPGLIAGGVTQINLQIGGMIASFQEGAVSYLYYADRLYQLPLGVVGVAIGVVLLPDVAAKLRAGDHEAVSDSQNRSLEFALLLTLPATIALFIAAEPIIRVLFERGAFRSAETTATAAALAAYALGLPAFVLQKVLQPAYFAREDTRTPMYFAFVNLAANVGLAVVLFLAFRAAGLMAHIGLALATSLAGWINVGLLWRTLKARGHFSVDVHARRRLPRIALASVVMGAALAALMPFLAPYLGSGVGSATRLGALSALIAAGLVVFAAAAELLGAVRWKRLLSRAAGQA